MNTKKLAQKLGITEAELIDGILNNTLDNRWHNEIMDGIAQRHGVERNNEGTEFLDLAEKGVITEDEAAYIYE